MPKIRLKLEQWAELLLHVWFMWCWTDLHTVICILSNHCNVLFEYRNTPFKVFCYDNACVTNFSQIQAQMRNCRSRERSLQDDFKTLINRIIYILFWWQIVNRKCVFSLFRRACRLFLVLFFHSVSVEKAVRAPVSVGIYLSIYGIT